MTLGALGGMLIEAVEYDQAFRIAEGVDLWRASQDVLAIIEHDTGKHFENFERLRAQWRWDPHTHQWVLKVHFWYVKIL